MCLKIEDLKAYLELMKEEVKYMNVGPKGEITNLVQKETEDAIYVYNVSEEDLPIVKERFFKEESRPILVRNYGKKEEERWIEDYGIILGELIRQQNGL